MSQNFDFPVCPICREPVREVYATISDQNHQEVQGYICKEHGEVEPVYNNES